MQTVEILGLVLGSGVIASSITVMFSRLAHSETLSLKYVTQERAKWRSNVKLNMSNLCEAINSSCSEKCKLIEIRKTSTFLKLSFNPNATEQLDQSVLVKIDEICSNPSYEKFVELETLVQKVLKHDWERAKLEAKSSSSVFISISVFIITIWSVFEYILKDTEIYVQLQKVDTLSGNYTEIAIAFLVIAAPFSLWSIRHTIVNYGKSVTRTIRNLTKKTK